MFYLSLSTYCYLSATQHGPPGIIAKQTLHEWSGLALPFDR
jgi:hypothetical protein